MGLQGKSDTICMQRLVYILAGNCHKSIKNIMDGKGGGEDSDIWQGGVRI